MKDFDWQKDDWHKIEFKDTLEVVSISRGRSAANFIAVSEDRERAYTIFITDFLDMFRSGEFKDGKFSGTWIVKKRGRNFGVRLKHTARRDCEIEYYKCEWPVPDYI